MAVELGKRFEECLIGDPNPSQGKVDAVSAALTGEFRNFIISSSSTDQSTRLYADII